MSFLIHSYMIPPFKVPSSTACLIDPERLILLMALIWWVCPWAIISPVSTSIPREVPKILLSISWVASALPARRESIYPSLIKAARYLPDPVCTIAGPPTIAILPPLLLISLISFAIPLIKFIKGFSEETSLFINSKVPLFSLDLWGGVTFIPSRPTTIISPALISAIGLTDAREFFSSTQIKQSISMFSTTLIINNPITFIENVSCMIWSRIKTFRSNFIFWRCN